MTDSIAFPYRDETSWHERWSQCNNILRGLYDKLVSEFDSIEDAVEATADYAKFVTPDGYTVIDNVEDRTDEKSGHYIFMFTLTVSRDDNIARITRETLVSLGPDRKRLTAEATSEAFFLQVLMRFS
jgi:hypothetical protein